MGVWNNSRHPKKKKITRKVEHLKTSSCMENIGNPDTNFVHTHWVHDLFSFLDLQCCHCWTLILAEPPLWCVAHQEADLFIYLFTRQMGFCFFGPVGQLICLQSSLMSSLEGSSRVPERSFGNIAWLPRCGSSHSLASGGNPPLLLCCLECLEVHFVSQFGVWFLIQWPSYPKGGFRFSQLVV